MTINHQQVIPVAVDAPLTEVLVKPERPSDNKIETPGSGVVSAESQCVRSSPKSTHSGLPPSPTAFTSAANSKPVSHKKYDQLTNAVALDTESISQVTKKAAPYMPQEVRADNRQSPLLAFNAEIIKAATAHDPKKPAKRMPGSKPIGIIKKIRSQLQKRAGPLPAPVKKNKGCESPNQQHNTQGDKTKEAKKKSTNTTTATAAVMAATKTPIVEAMLRAVQRWLIRPRSYLIRNAETGCFGLSSRNADGERSEITIAHTVGCECLDIGLSYLCRHVDALVRRHRLGRRSRDALVIALKIRLDLGRSLPLDMQFPTTRQGKGRDKVNKRRRRAEIETAERVIDVVDYHRHQHLVEKWKNLKAYRTRSIWKDW